jgi:hypothetical protein
MRTRAKSRVDWNANAFMLALAAATATSAYAEPPSNRADPCVLVTSADAQAAVGIPMGQAKAMDDGLYRHCTYVSADGRYILNVSTIEDDEASFEQGRKITTKNSKTVAGLAANAYFDLDHQMLLVFRKGILLNVQVSDHSGNSSVAQLEAIDEKAGVIAVPRL